MRNIVKWGLIIIVVVLWATVYNSYIATHATSAAS